MSLVEEQNPPQKSEGDVWLLVLRDMEERRQHGIEKYGVPVQPHNGRDPLVDLFQELLDATVYCRQEIEQRNIERQKVYDYLYIAAGVAAREGVAITPEGLRQLAANITRGEHLK